VFVARKDGEVRRAAALAYPNGAMAVVFDLIGLASGLAYWSEIAYWMIAAGVVTGLLFAGSWLLRDPETRLPGGAELALSFVGAALLLVTGWLGGELVDRLAVGVDDGAHVNAPSSLRSHRI
jgi:uncharacterized membrane protein